MSTKLDVFDRLIASVGNALTYLTPADQNKARKKIRAQASDDRQVTHTAHELYAGVFMARLGYTTQYEPKINGRTPDWRFTGAGGQRDLLADVVNFHLPQIEDELARQVVDHQDKDAIVSTCFWQPDNQQRLFSALQEKARKYRELAAATGLPYVVFVYGDWLADLRHHDFIACLSPSTETEVGLFESYPTLAGVCHIGHGLMSELQFTYYPSNVHAEAAAFEILNGTLPIPLPTAIVVE